MKFKFSDALNVSKAFIGKHSPEILTGIGIAGMITSTILAVKATPKAIDQIIDREEELEVKKLPPVEVVKTCWKLYIPAVATGAASIACIVGANNISASRYSAIATAYKLSETALSEYKDAVVETVGEKKEREVRDKVAEKKVEKNPIECSPIVETGHGNQLCHDGTFGRYFKSCQIDIQRACNELNRMIVNDEYASLNDFYILLGLEPTHAGDKLGWNREDGEICVEFSAQLADGQPCMVIDFNRMPKYDFDMYS